MLYKKLRMKKSGIKNPFVAFHFTCIPEIFVWTYLVHQRGFISKFVYCRERYIAICNEIIKPLTKYVSSVLIDRTG